MKKWILALLPFLFLSSVHAKGLYFGAAYLAEVKFDESGSDLDDTVEIVENLGIGVSIDDSDQGFRLLAGYRFNPYTAVEVAYADLGKWEASASIAQVGTEISYEAESERAITIAALVNTPTLANRFNLYAKAGMGQVKWDTEISESVPGIDISFDNDGEDETVIVGAGATIALSKNITVRAEYEYWDDIENISIDVFSIGLQFQLSRK